MMKKEEHKELFAELQNLVCHQHINHSVHVAFPPHNCCYFFFLSMQYMLSLEKEKFPQIRNNVWNGSCHNRDVSSEGGWIKAQHYTM